MSDDMTPAERMALPTPATIEDAVRERDLWINSASQAHEAAQYYRAIVIDVGRQLGPKIHFQDDGGVVDDVLCAKVVELTRERLDDMLRCIALFASVIKAREAWSQHCQNALDRAKGRAP